MHLVIGGDGLIGRAVCHELSWREIEFGATSRRIPLLQSRHFSMFPLDLLDAAQTSTFPQMAFVPPDTGVVYLVAAVPGHLKCKGNPESGWINRDAPIALAQFYRDCFVVFLSSDVVDKDDWMGSPYRAHKEAVENYINCIRGAIIRPTKVAADRAGELAKVIVDVGLARKAGVTRWS